jgi:hypothetical protein
MVFAFTIPKTECEAIIVYGEGFSRDISWPIRTEAEAYKLAKDVGVPGFWRLKHRPVK